MTPPRVVQLKCPKCATTHWTIDNDYRGIGGRYIDYFERDYHCHGCEYSGEGYNVLQQSPPSFFLQPHPMYPMRQKDFDYWADILKSHFPDHPQIGQLGKEFRPNSQVFLTELRNRWLHWKDRARRRVIVIRVDIEDWLAKRLPKKTGGGTVGRALKPMWQKAIEPDSVNIFVSHSHFPNDCDAVFKLADYFYKRFWKDRIVVKLIADQQVEVHTAAVEIWCNRWVTTTDAWQDELDENEFLSANYILLMVSPDYLASDYCRRQMNHAEEREQMGLAKVIPVILRPVEWSLPAFWELLPRNGQPVANWPNREEAFADIAEGVLQAIPAEVSQKWVDRRLFID